MDDARARAVERAYALIEAAQGEENTAGALDVAGAEATAHGWDDVLALVHYATSFAARYAGRDSASTCARWWRWPAGPGIPPCTRWRWPTWRPGGWSRGRHST